MAEDLAESYVTPFMLCLFNLAVTPYVIFLVVKREKHTRKSRRDKAVLIKNCFF